MKKLDGRELAGYIKERQAVDVRRLKAKGIQPKLVIFYDNDSPVIAKYMELKKEYGADIGVEAEIVRFDENDAAEKMKAASKDLSVNGIIVQLPLEKVSGEILELIPAEKDVDGLNGGMDSATAEAINWLLGGHNIELGGKKIAIVGRGKLVGAPLEKIWKNSGYDVTVFEKGDSLSELNQFDVVVSATGVPGLIKPDMIKSGAVIVDAGTASEDGNIVGDVHESVRKIENICITPKFGGVGPLTVTLLFEHLLKSNADLLRA